MLYFSYKVSFHKDLSVGKINGENEQTKAGNALKINKQNKTEHNFVEDINIVS